MAKTLLALTALLALAGCGDKPKAGKPQQVAQVTYCCGVNMGMPEAERGGSVMYATPGHTPPAVLRRLKLGWKACWDGDATPTPNGTPHRIGEKLPVCPRPSRTITKDGKLVATATCTGIHGGHCNDPA